MSDYIYIYILSKYVCIYAINAKGARWAHDSEVNAPVGAIFQISPARKFVLSLNPVKYSVAFFDS